MTSAEQVAAASRGRSGAQRSYEDLVAEAMSAATRGWDFGFLTGRVRADPLPWDYPELARAAVRTAATILDVDTGGGEVLASVLPAHVRPGTVIAVEPHPPNLPVARERLEPGVEVRSRQDGLPVSDGWAELVLNRHGAIDAAETARVLAPDGHLITQQVDAGNNSELNELLGAPRFGGRAVSETVDRLAAAGLEILDCTTAQPAVCFGDIGAVIFQLRKVPWQIPDFTPTRYDGPLRALDARIRSDGPVLVHDRRALLRARRP